MAFRCIRFHHSVAPSRLQLHLLFPPTRPPPILHIPLQRSGVLAPADSDSDFSFSSQLSTLDKKLDQLVYGPGPTISLHRGKTGRCTFPRYYGALERSRRLIESDESEGRKRFSGPSRDSLLRCKQLALFDKETPTKFMRSSGEWRRSF